MTVYFIDFATGYLHRDGALVSTRHIGEGVWISIGMMAIDTHPMIDAREAAFVPTYVHGAIDVSFTLGRAIQRRIDQLLYRCKGTSIIVDTQVRKAIAERRSKLGTLSWSEWDAFVRDEIRKAAQAELDETVARVHATFARTNELPCENGLIP